MPGRRAMRGRLRFRPEGDSRSTLNIDTFITVEAAFYRGGASFLNGGFMIRKITAAALLASAFAASPAVARDHQVYVGVEAGALFVKDIHARATEGFATGGGGGPALSTAAVGPLAVSSSNYFIADMKTGFDGDVVVGYDWGAVRTELEGSYRSAKFDTITVDPNDFVFGGVNDANGRITSRSIALNVLGDLPLGNGFTLSAGPGIGYARITANPRLRLFGNGNYTNLQSTRDNGLIVQGIAMIRQEIGRNLEAGLKYRYVRSDRRSYDSDYYGKIQGRLTAHSLMASLLYSFAGPRAVVPPVVEAPVAPPPPPPAATQTCADGSVILASDLCPAPPAPAPVPQPGERG